MLYVKEFYTGNEYLNISIYFKQIVEYLLPNIYNLYKSSFKLKFEIFYNLRSKNER